MLEFAPETPQALQEGIGYRSASDAFLDPRGRLVRVTPRRRTSMLELADGTRIFCKMRRGRRADALAEWRALRELPALGVRVPQPVFLAISGGDSIVGMRAVPGRPMDALLREGGFEEALRVLPARLRALHDAGWFYRDMYWNHVFLDPGAGIALIDAERVFQPRTRRDRWLVKDLAGLLSSVPQDARVGRTAALRFLRDYLGGLSGEWKDLARRVVAKADRIRAHVTRYPG
jgi:tRNA A-37 threonylcarbamoyl transferase component Bud32